MSATPHLRMLVVPLPDPRRAQSVTLAQANAGLKSRLHDGSFPTPPPGATRTVAAR